MNSRDTSGLRNLIVMHSNDNVATALKDLEEGKSLNVEVGDIILEINPISKIDFGHKLSIKKIEQDENIIKYGEIIGKATKPIEIGAHVHVHNVESQRGRGDL